MVSFRETVRRIISAPNQRSFLGKEPLNCTYRRCHMVARVLSEYLADHDPLGDSDLGPSVSADQLLRAPRTFSAYYGNIGDHHFILFTYMGQGMIVQGIQTSPDSEGLRKPSGCDFGVKTWLGIEGGDLDAHFDEDDRCRKAIAQYGRFTTFSLADYAHVSTSDPAKAGKDIYAFDGNSTIPDFYAIRIANSYVVDQIRELELPRSRERSRSRTRSRSRSRTRSRSRSRSRRRSRSRSQSRSRSRSRMRSRSRSRGRTRSRSRIL